jgi:hypothetical protein
MLKEFKGQYLVAKIVCNIIQAYSDIVSEDLNADIEIQRDNSSNENHTCLMILKME